MIGGAGRAGGNIDTVLFQRVQQQPIVKSASLTIAATPRLSRTDLLDFSVTITLQPADKEAAA